MTDSTPFAEPTPQPTALPAQLLHDLRTPVHQIVGYVEMLQEDAAGNNDAALARDLEKVKSAAAQLQKMLEVRFVGARETSDSVAPRPAPAPASIAETGNDEPTLASGDERGLLLIVDDNETNRDVLSRRLQMQGYSIETACDGARALEMVAARVFDLVLLDIMMPDMDGYEVLRRLKADEQTRALPVIMISALDDLDSVVRCIELGAEDYLPKPFNPTLLKARIGACLEKKRGRDREQRLFVQLQTNYIKLQEAEKMRDDLTNMIVHDLRTPLSSLLAGLQTIGMLGPLLPQQQECCDIALRGGFSLLDMINDLLDISKLESGASGLDIRMLDVAALIEESCEQVQAAAASRQIALQYDFAPDLPALPGDKDKLRRTLVNLLGNAIKFSLEDAPIVIRAQSDEKEMTLSVRDYGEGIPREAFERIFEKFGQAQNRRAGRMMSTGLGLALCKMVVEAHQGRIWVESELGRGSTFYVALPL